MTDAQQALVRVLDPGYLERLEERTLDEVRAMHTECVELENFYSYVRRIVQGRVDILTADAQRRASGGSLDELVASLPKILGDDESRPSPGTTRLVPRLAPGDEYELPPELQRVIANDVLAKLATLGDDELRGALEELTEVESRVSSDRHALHEVIDRLERDLAARLVVEA